jgi:hypothetical protein
VSIHSSIQIALRRVYNESFYNTTFYCKKLKKIDIFSKNLQIKKHLGPQGQIFQFLSLSGEQSSTPGYATSPPLSNLYSLSSPPILQKIDKFDQKHSVNTASLNQGRSRSDPVARKAFPIKYVGYDFKETLDCPSCWSIKFFYWLKGQPIRLL